jgi:hypothetical protein
MFLSTIRWGALAEIILVPTSAMAQSSVPPAATSNAQLLEPAELDQLVAPIALCPDPLLAQLMASASTSCRPSGGLTGSSRDELAIQTV